jgi:hypothetical protein
MRVADRRPTVREDLGDDLIGDPNILASWNPIALWLRQLDNLRLAV